MPWRWGVKRLRWHDYISINIYWLGLNMLSGSMTPIILPVLVQRFVPDAVKNTFYGNLRFYGLMVALLVQPVAGMLSDRFRSPLGRRRPFIIVGALLNLLFIAAIGFADGYQALFAATLLLQASSNIAHGALQGLIPDLVPEDQRGRASAVKAIMELLPAIIIAFTIARLVGAGQVWTALLLVAGSVLVTMLLTVLTVREKASYEPVRAPLAEPLTRTCLLVMSFLLIVQGLRAVTLWVGQAVQGSLTLRLFVVGGTGLLAVVAAIVAGVWASVWLGIGPAIRRYPSFAWWVVNRLLFLAAVSSLQGVALYFLEDVIRIANPAATAGNLMLVIGLLTVCAVLPSGMLCDRFGRKPLLIGSGLVAGVGIVLLMLASDLWLIYVGGSLVGMAAGVFMTTNWALGTDLAPRAESGRFLGISNLAGAGAGAVGASIGGPLTDYFNALQPGLGYKVIFGIFAVCLFLSAVVLAWVPEGHAAHTRATLEG